MTLERIAEIEARAPSVTLDEVLDLCALARECLAWRLVDNDDSRGWATSEQREARRLRAENEEAGRMSKPGPHA